MVVVLLYLGSILQEKKKDEHNRGKEGFNHSPLPRWGVWTSVSSLWYFFCRPKIVCIFLCILLILAVATVGFTYLACHLTKSRGKGESLGGPYQIQAVATDHEECSKIGNDTLNSNGSAVDAAIAAIFCLGVINMHSSGVGGGGVMLVYNRNLKKAQVIDFRETAPAATTSDMFPPTESGENKSKYGKCYFSFLFLPP